MGVSGAVDWMFDHRGVVEVTIADGQEDDLMEAVMDYAEEIEVAVGATDLDASVICAPTDLAKLRNATTDAGFEVETAELTYIPNQTQEIADEEVVQQFQDFLEELEDNEDVQRFFHNAELPDDEDDE